MAGVARASAFSTFTGSERYMTLNRASAAKTPKAMELKAFNNKAVYTPPHKSKD